MKRRLTVQEVRALADTGKSVLERLSQRYLPNLDISKGMPLRVEFLDVLRGMWLLDPRPDRPPYTDIVSGVGYGLGAFLNKNLNMDWCLIEDSCGEDVSMVLNDDSEHREYSEISVPPFNYVSKRENTQNVEVIADAVKEIRKLTKR